MQQLYYFYEFNKKTIWTVTSVITAILVITGIYVYENTTPYIYPHELVAIDSLCDTNTEKAKSELVKVARKYNGDDSEEKWYYRFLTLKASIKANETQKNDKEIKVLLDHFEHPKGKNVLPQVYYCAGCVYKSLEDLTLSNQYFTKIIEEFNTPDKENLIALCYYQLGHNFSTQGLNKESLSCQIKSYSYHKKNKDLRRMMFDCEDLSWTYGNLNQPEKAMSYLKKARSFAHQINAIERYSEIECLFAINYMEADKLEKAKMYVDKALKLPHELNKSELFSTALEIYSKCGITDKALSFCDTVLADGNIYGKKYAYWWLSTYHAGKGEAQEALKYINKYKEYTDIVSNAISVEASANANAMYNYSIREKENLTLQKENSIKKLYIFIAISLLLALAFISTIVYVRVNHKKRLIEKRYKILEELSAKKVEEDRMEILKKEKEIEDIKKLIAISKGQDTYENTTLQNFLNDENDKLDKLNQVANLKKRSNSYIKKSDIYKKLIEAKQTGNTNSDLWKELRDFIFNTFPNFENNLSELCPMSDTEMKVCLLIRAGFSSTDIAHLIYKSRNSIYSINRRLYYKNFGIYDTPSKWENLIKSIY